MTADVFLIDDLTPEDCAMLQALYSRDGSSARVHLQKVKDAGSRNFMKTHYVGYNHKSIGDCGTTTLFFEGVSMLAAKAIQDWPLYSGQETSTRYLNMADRPIVDPVDTSASRAIMARWMDFYRAAQEPVAAWVRERHPRREGEDEKVYDRAVRARTFDITRGFLPAGVSTQLSWHTNLRQANDHLAWMARHPLDEVVSCTAAAMKELDLVYPSSFGHALRQEQVEYLQLVMRREAYYRVDGPGEAPTAPDAEFFGDYRSPTVWLTSRVNKWRAAQYGDVFNSRPPRTELPHFLADLGSITFEFALDFGSFRDLQRHRNGVCRMPLLTTEYGFHEWYVEQLPPDVRRSARELIQSQSDAIRVMPISDEVRQYYVAMGYRVPCKVTYGLPATVYLLELRTPKVVHPTMRQAAIRMAEAFQLEFPFVKLHVDDDPDDWDVRRGKQTIEKRKE